MEPITISAIVIASASFLSIVAKFIHSMRNDIKSCFGFQFRTPTNSQNNIKTEDINIDILYPNQIVNNIRAIQV